MCARGMDAGINGDFEYLINESSPASKSAFEPSSLFFARVSLPPSLSLSFCILFSSFLCILALLFFFFRSSIIARTNFCRWISSIGNFRVCISFRSNLRRV